MFGNYFKTAFRNLKKTKLFSMINILGLAIGKISGLLKNTIIKLLESLQTYQRTHILNSIFFFRGKILNRSLDLNTPIIGVILVLILISGSNQT